MQTNELNSDLLRRLADLHPEGARVLSLFLNLDPSEFATPPARATEVRSLIDQAERRAREIEPSLSHDEKMAVREDIARASDHLSRLSVDGAHGLAVFACGPADLFEVIKLPRPIDTRAVVDDSPFVEPLAELAMRGSWCVLLVNRQVARMLRGSPEHLEELPPVEDEVHGRHDQGGWSQARYQRSVEEEARSHLKRAAEVAFRRFQRSPFDCILLGGPEETVGEFEGILHPYLRERVAGRFRIDVENTTPDQIREAAAPVIDEIDERREREALDRLEEGVATGGRGAAGLDETIGVLNERRVEILLLGERFDAAGVLCRRCGWLGTDSSLTECPADGGPLEPRENITENAIELAILQSASVLRVRHHAERLEARGSIGAVLRY
ncbi:MAG: peptide chain release factor subunit 1 [Thermoleophilaceae bacterium]|jgi:peptide subunit release factor 1 (eRF1)|nr:peptide chain release factor subunit 1 [Thermoleophilaceae bacterium]